MVEYNRPPISLFFYSITNFLFYCQSNILATQTKIDKAIINLPSTVFTSIPSPFSSLIKDAQLDNNSVTFSFFSSKDKQFDKFAI